MALVLTRERGERLYLELSDGREIVIEAARIERGRVSLAIMAPNDVRVLREEVRADILAGRKPGDRVRVLDKKMYEPRRGRRRED